MDSSRTEILIGPKGLEILSRSRVAVYGVGGVGGYALEAVVRAGVGSLFICDYDQVTSSNVNRQILALQSTMGSFKTEIAELRAKEIQPKIHIETCTIRLTPENIGDHVPGDLTFAIDAIDEVDAKVALIKTFYERGIPFITSMGSGSRLDPLGYKIDDISKTSYCPLARAVRKRLRESGITTGVMCVYSEENLHTVRETRLIDGRRKSVNGTISYMPGLAGLIASGYAIRYILENNPA